MEKTLKLIGIIVLAFIAIKVGMAILSFALSWAFKIALVALFVGGALYLVGKLVGGSRSLSSGGKSLP